MKCVRVAKAGMGRCVMKKWVVFSIGFFSALGMAWNFSGHPEKDVFGVEAKKAEAAEVVAAAPYDPPKPEAAPEHLRNAVMLGHNIMINTRKYAGPYVGNKLNCTNCHFDGGMTKGGKNGGLSLVGVATQYPQYRERAKGIVDLAYRTNSCFVRSMNGKPLPAESKEMVALLTYYQWISKGLLIYEPVSWLGLEPLKSESRPDVQKGSELFQQSCAMCHGKEGQGIGGPPLWGDSSFNDGAGMAAAEKLAAFVHLNMPQGNPDLTVIQALDVAAFVDGRPRPHFTGERRAQDFGKDPGYRDPSGFEPLPVKPPIPQDNPMTPEKIELGKQLYFDPRLSVNGTIACQSCHDVFLSGTSNLPVPVGVYGKIDGDRQDPTVWNAAFKTAQFWDGRAPSLEEQAKGPLFNPVEMGTNPQLLVKRLMEIPGYVSRFKSVFGGENSITVDNAVKAIAAYERTLITPGGPLDRYLEGDGKAIGESARKGMSTVKALGCMSCHFGPNFSGPTQPMGHGFFQKFPIYTDDEYVKKYNLLEDPGRYRVTHKESDKHMWIVQTWRNIALTAPYFNNGTVKDLGTAVEVMAKTELDKAVSRDEGTHILAFFATLTGDFPKQTMPRLPATPGTTLLMEYR
jgi:cytochrome c peroxidase